MLLYHLKDRIVNGSTLSFSEEIFEGAIEGQKFSNALFYNARFDHTYISRCVFNSCDFSGVMFDFAHFTDCEFNSCLFDNADMTTARILDCEFIGCEMSGVVGIPTAAEFLRDKFTFNEQGLIAYKIFNMYHTAPDRWDIQPGAVLTETVDRNVFRECSYGINVANLKWFDDKLPRYSYVVWEVLIPWIDLADVVVPVRSDGKIRCRTVTLVRQMIREVDEKTLNPLHEDEHEGF